MILLLFLIAGMLPFKEASSCQHLERKISDLASSLEHVLNGGAERTVVADQCGMRLLDEERLGEGTPNVLVRLENLSLQSPQKISHDFVFVLMDEDSKLDQHIKTMEAHISVEGSYIFLFPGPMFDFALELSHSTDFSKVRRLMFAWPVAAAANSSSSPFQVEFLSPEPPMGRKEGQNLRVMGVKPSSAESGAAVSFPRREADLRGRTVRVTTFPFPPLIFQSEQGDGSTLTHGFEPRVLNGLARILNFSPSYRRPTDGGFFGLYVEENNTFNGLLGDLQHGRTDVGLANLWIRTETNWAIGFTAPYNYDGMCFLVPKPGDHVDLVALTRPFSLPTWICLLVCTLSCCGLLVCGVILFGEEEYGTSASEGVLYILASVLNEHFPFRPKLASTRVLLAPFLLSSCVLVYGYSGILTSYMTITVPPKLLEKVTDLLTLEADPAAPANAINMTKQFLQDPNPAYRPLAARFKTFPSIDEGIDLIKKRSIVHISSRFRHEYFLRNLLVGEDGEPMGYRLKECWQSLYSVGWGLQRNSPLQELVNDKFVMLQDAGVVQKWLKDSFDEIGRTELGRGKSVGSETLEMKDMVSAFLTWSLFLIPALLAFPLEVVLGRRREKSFQDFQHASENRGRD